MNGSQEQSIKLTISVGGDERRCHHPLFAEVLRILREQGLTSATLTKGIMSYGRDRQIHSTMNEITSENLPIIIELIGEQVKTETAAKLIAEMLGGRGLVELHRTTVIRHAATEKEK
jgi:PII-like signaling protein